LGLLQAQSVIARWRAARRLYPVYSALALQFELSLPPCRDLDDVDVHSEPDLLEKVEYWFGELDEKLEVQHFRQLLHGTGVGTSEEKLNALIERHLRKPSKTEADRDKLDFLLVQYFAVCAPPSFQDRDLTLSDIAEILEPVLGRGPFDFPEWLKPLDGWIASLQQFKSLDEMEQSRIVQQGRQLKEAARHLYFTPAALLAFTRFSYSLRRTFFRLIDADLKAMEASFDLLEQRGCGALDCRALGLSANTPLDELHHYATDFRNPQVPEYSAASMVPRIVDLRRILTNAVAATEPAGGAAWQQIERRFRRVEEELADLRAFVASLLANRDASAAPPVAVERLRSSLPDPPQVDVDVTFDFARAPGPETAGADQLTSAIEEAEEKILEDDEEPLAEVSAKPEPEVEPETVPLPGETPSAASEQDPHAVALVHMIEEIRKRLNAAGRRGISSIAIAGTALLLTADEVEAFTRPKEGSSVHVQRALAVRALLLHALETHRRAGHSGLASVVEFCHEELRNIQKRSGEARQANRMEFAAALTASGNQLGTLLKQAERIARAAVASPATV
jgi:hypothetical protein